MFFVPPHPSTVAGQLSAAPVPLPLSPNVPPVFHAPIPTTPDPTQPMPMLHPMFGPGISTVPMPRPVDQGFGPIGPVGTQPGGGQMSQGNPITTDAQLAHSASQHLSNALASVTDPELRQSLATAMATLHKYVAGIHKEHQDALAGKVSPRLLQHAYGTTPIPRGSALMFGPAAGSVL